MDGCKKMSASNGNVNGTWKFIATVLSSVLITGLTSWFAFGGGMKRDEVRDLIRTESPYVEDRKLILDKLNRIVDDIKEIKSRK